MKTNNLVAIIMAGGGGERLWPRSTSTAPKHLVKFNGKKTMLEETIKRLKPLVSLKKIFVVTRKEDAGTIQKFCPKFPSSNIIIEPYRRNTAACIGLAVVFIKKKFPGAIISVFPSDHVIKEKARFLDTIRFGAFRAGRENAFVIIGIKPDAPETGYGYIEVNGKIGEKKGIPRRSHPFRGIHKVKRFVEKPDLKRAKAFVSSNKYLWNGGMFIFKADVILKAFGLFMPQLYRGLLKIEAHLSKGDRDKVIEKVYRNLKSISIDCGVMEKVKNRLVVKADFFWSDVGSWTSLEELYPKDKRGNISLGDTLSLDTHNSILVSDKGLLVALGIKDMAVVSTQDVTVVFPKDRAQEVKRVVESIRKKRPFKKYL